jgi:hypothetical protein
MLNLKIKHCKTVLFNPIIGEGEQQPCAEDGEETPTEIIANVNSDTTSKLRLINYPELTEMLAPNLPAELVEMMGFYVLLKVK